LREIWQIASRKTSYFPLNQNILSPNRRETNSISCLGQFNRFSAPFRFKANITFSIGQRRRRRRRRRRPFVCGLVLSATPSHYFYCEAHSLSLSSSFTIISLFLPQCLSYPNHFPTYFLTDLSSFLPRFSLSLSLIHIIYLLIDWQRYNNDPRVLTC
jgi:hypothetical protein